MNVEWDQYEQRERHRQERDNKRAQTSHAT